MPSRRTESPTPDLFAAEGCKELPLRTRVCAPLPRYRLPKDLAGALSHLDDGEIDTLLATVAREAERRGRYQSVETNKTAKPADTNRQADRGPGFEPRTKLGPRRPAQAHPNDAARSLTLGQTNTVRAAFAAGVKPSVSRDSSGSRKPRFDRHSPPRCGEENRNTVGSGTDVHCKAMAVTRKVARAACYAFLAGAVTKVGAHSRIVSEWAAQSLARAREIP